jgi:hypothetical protein
MNPELWVHGKRVTYTVRKCRCDLCAQANRDYQRQWQANPAQREYMKNYMRSRYAQRKLMPLGRGPLEPEAIPRAGSTESAFPRTPPGSEG